MFGMVFAHLMLPEEPLQLPKLLGALLAVGGVAMICERLLGFSGRDGFLGGLGIILGAASAAFSNVLLKARAIQLAPAMMGCLANDFRRSAVALDRIYGRGKSLEVSLERRVDVLSALPCGNRLGADLLLLLLAIAANDC